MVFFLQIKPQSKRYLSLFIFSFAIGCILFAQYPEMPIASKILNVEMGLPDEYITCMTQDSLGYMWIGTPAGLCRYDGVNITTWLHDDQDSTSLSHNWVLSLHYNHTENELWVGTARGLNFFDLEKEKFKKSIADSSSKFDLTKEWITGIVCDKEKKYWIYNLGLHHYDPKTHQLNLYQNGYNSPTNIITLAIFDKYNDDILWLATMDGYVKFNIKTKQFDGHYFYHNADKSIQNRINQVERCIYQHDDGRIFGGGLNGGLTIFDPSTEAVSLFKPKWKNHKFSSKLNYKSIIRINKNLLCIGMDTGMIWYNPTTDEVLNFLPNTKYLVKTITPHHVDKNNKIWISSSEGIEIYDSYFNQFSSYDFDKKIMPNQFFTIKLLENTSSNKLFFIQSGANEIYSFDLKSNTYLTPLLDKKENWSTADILLNKKNELLLLTKTDVYKYKNEHWKNMKIAPKLKTPPYISFLEGKQQDLFLLSTFDGMFRLSFPEMKAKHYDEKYFHREGAWLKNAFYDSNNKLWVNHLNIGFSVFDFQNDSFQIAFLDNENPLKTPRIKDQVWINDSLLMVCGGQQGLGIIHRDKVEEGVYKKFILGENGLVTDRIYAFEKDETGQIWMLSDIGIQVYHPKTKGFQFFSYPDTKFNITSELLDQFFLKQLSDGRMVFAYRGGLVFFDPSLLFRNQEQISPLLSSIHILDKKKDAIYFKKNKIKLAYDENYITFDFSSIGFTAPKKNTFKYKLHGIDNKWTMSETDQVKYAQLPSGEYTFDLKVANNDYVWSDKIASISFTIKPPWWHTWWARSGYAIVLLCGFFYWYDNRKKKWKLATEIEVQKQKVQTLHKEKEVELLNAIIMGEEKERARLSRELHDSVGAMVSSIKMYFQTLIRDNPALKSDKTFNHTKELIAETYQEVRNISHNLMPFDIYELGLETALKNLCDKYTEGANLEVNYQFYVDDVPIEQEVQLNLYRIVQEILKNTSIHANAKTVHLQLSIDQESIHLEIENDGDIFDIQKALAKKGIGLKNISTRVKYIKGELDIVSNKEIGTVFSVYINT